MSNAGHECAGKSYKGFEKSAVLESPPGKLLGRPLDLMISSLILCNISYF